MKNFIALLLFTLLFCGCKKEEPMPRLEVRFVSHLLGQFAPCKIQFESLTPGEDYEWSFDGQAPTSAVQHPIVTFHTPGTYNVTLKVSGTDGGGETTQTVVVPPAATHFKINTIVLSQYPMFKISGTSWDPSPYSGPDIFFTILGLPPSFDPLYKHEAKMQDVSIMRNINFIIPDGLLLPVVDNNYSMIIHDWDETFNETMGSLTFNPWYYVVLYGYYPDSFLSAQQGCTATFKVTWH